jgi:hypothetical protein
MRICYIICISGEISLKQNRCSYDNLYDYVGTPPPDYDQVMKVNLLPNYKDAIQLQKLKY